MRDHRLASALRLCALLALAACAGGESDTEAGEAVLPGDTVAPGMVTGTTGAPGPGTAGTPGTPAAPAPDTLEQP